MNLGFIRCKVCAAGGLQKKKIHHLGGFVALIGWCMLLGSLAVGGLGALMLVFSGGSAGRVMERQAQEEAAKLEAAHIPSAVIELFKARRTIPDADLEALSSEQRQAITFASARLAGGTIGAAMGGAIGGGLALFLVCCSCVGALSGWLLRLKKQVLQCDNCGAVVAAS